MNITLAGGIAIGLAIFITGLAVALVMSDGARPMGHRCVSCGGTFFGTRNEALVWACAHPCLDATTGKPQEAVAREMSV